MPTPEECKVGIDAFVENASKRLGELNRQVTKFLRNTIKTEVNSDRSGKTLSWLMKNITHMMHSVLFLKRMTSK
jgi:hypothetical protein